jgi:uncharacterized protein
MSVLQIAHQLHIKPNQVEAVLALHAEGGTVPFIARYRKDRTGALDEVIIQQILDESKRLKELEERKAAIIKSIEEQGKLTEALAASIQRATTLSQVEDLYLPYKPKRKTKGSIAREKGLEPLALWLLEQTTDLPETKATAFFTDQVTSVDEALQGARDILAEMFNEDASLREKLRRYFETAALMKTSVLTDKETEGIKYKDFFDYSEPIQRIPSHRVLAILRGFLEGFLRLSIEPEETGALEIMEGLFIKGMSPSSMHIRKACIDAYRRLLQPSLETEFRTALKIKADEEAIQVFAENLRQLLLSAPLGAKRILAIDPGYRTGCKVVCLDEKGELLETALIYVHEKNRLEEARYTVQHLINQHQIQAFAIGDGTAGRETEQFIKQLQTGLPVFLVNEDGASVYSASEVAREEFPDQDITVRGSVSIGRRLLDPLAELVKIDPKSIGVGQYQHDVNQAKLKERLDQTVMSCVNAVGVNLNTASKHLLTYVSGIGPTLAAQIVKYRKEKGGFQSRQELKSVPRLGDKAFEQCAGFLRIRESAHPLDNSAVHPEAYAVVDRMALDLQVPVAELIGNNSLIQSIQAKQYVSETVGLHSINDILQELKKPGLDPRQTVQTFEFAPIYSIEDVHAGMEVPGIVTNLTRFGAFVDIGVKQDGLVHVSEMANRFIKDPAEVVKLNQPVQVKVLEVDVARKRIVLSMKQHSAATPVRNDRPPVKKTARVQQPVENFTDALSQLKNKFAK